MEFLENAICSKVMATFADHLDFLCFLMNARYTRDSDGLFQLELCIDPGILLITLLTHNLPVKH